MILVMLACGGVEIPHGHDHPADGVHAHDADPSQDRDLRDRDGAPVAQAVGITAPLGTYTARLEPRANALRLVVVDGDGKGVPAEGEAKIVLTGTGEEAQRVVLTAEGEAWSGPAKAEGAPGYHAVVKVSVGGHDETARFVWGEVPDQQQAPAAHSHGDDGHDHAEGGHSHGHTH